MSECAITELPSAMCAHCKGLTLPSGKTSGRRPTAGPEPFSIPAKYHGRCIGCGRAIYPGDSISQVDGDWLCTNCAE